MCRVHAGLSANEKVRKSKKEWGHEERKGGGEMFLESVTHRGRGRGETSLIHTDLQAVSGTHKKRTGKKAGHISQAPENVRVILGLVLLIDEWGVFKLLPLSVHVLVVTVHGKQLNAFGSLI